MPNSATAKKRLRQSIDRREENRAVRSQLRTQLRKVREAVDAGDLEKCETEFRAAVKELDKAAARKVIHRNNAARTKSRLSKSIKAIKA